MELSDDVVKAAWEKAGGKCQCKNEKCEHKNRRCNRVLVWQHRGKGGWGVWQARVKGSGKGYGEVEILCWKCYKRTTK